MNNKNLYIASVIGVLILSVVVIGSNFDFLKGITNQEASVAELSYRNAKELEVGNAYNAFGCKNENYQGTKNHTRYILLKQVLLTA